MKLWLDDIRPAPQGWEWVKNIKQAIEILQTDKVDEASLDHDLGACDACMKLYEAMDADEWLIRSKGSSMPHCPHVGTGHQLVLWMHLHNVWPKMKPIVHSMNPAGHQRMVEDINRYFPGDK